MWSTKENFLNKKCNLIRLFSVLNDQKRKIYWVFFCPWPKNSFFVYDMFLFISFSQTRKWKKVSHLWFAIWKKKSILLFTCVGLNWGITLWCWKTRKTKQIVIYDPKISLFGVCSIMVSILMIYTKAYGNSKNEGDNNTKIAKTKHHINNQCLFLMMIMIKSSRWLLLVESFC